MRDRLKSKVMVQELRDGVEVSTTSYVGSIRTGPLTIRIAPKLAGPSFSALLAYAVGLPPSLLPDYDAALTATVFQDLIVSVLASEISRLLAGGIYRTYVRRERSLASPRGRILFSHLARGPMATATLPCRFDERHENVLPNRVLRAGLDLAAQRVVDREIRTRVVRLRTTLADRVESVPLSEDTFWALRHTSSRLTSTYETSFALIRLLVAGFDVGLEGGAKRTQLPGFLLDMNRLFQDVLERFLREWLDDATVVPQYRLRDVFRYEPGFNPRRQQSPVLKPDYVVQRRNSVVAIVDAKYRDLWKQSLPPSMLYQLSVYALGHPHCPSAVILYATDTSDASEARIAISDPVRGGARARVVLRPVSLPRLAELVGRERTADNNRRRHEYAAYLAYGLQSR